MISEPKWSHSILSLSHVEPSTILSHLTHISRSLSTFYLLALLGKEFRMSFLNCSPTTVKPSTVCLKQIPFCLSCQADRAKDCGSSVVWSLISLNPQKFTMTISLSVLKPQTLCHLPHWWVLHLVTQSCLTLRNPMDYSPPGSPVHGHCPDKNTAVGCHALLQEIFPTQGSNPGRPHGRQTLYHLSHQGSPSSIVPSSNFSKGSSLHPLDSLSPQA